MDTQHQAGRLGPAGIEALEAEHPELRRNDLDRPPPLPEALSRQGKPLFRYLCQIGEPEGQPVRLGEPAPGLFRRNRKNLTAAELDSRDVPLTDRLGHPANPYKGPAAPTPRRGSGIDSRDGAGATGARAGC